MISLLRKGKSSISFNLSASSSDRSSSIPRGPHGLRLDHPSGPLRRRHPPRFLPLPVAGGRGRNFEGSSPPLQPQHSRSALACMAIMRRRWMDSCSPSAGILDLIPSPPTCVAGTPGAVVLCSGVGSCVSSSGGSLQNARTRGPAGSRVLQSTIPGREGDPSSTCQH